MPSRPPLTRLTQSNLPPDLPQASLSPTSSSAIRQSKGLPFSNPLEVSRWILFSMGIRIRVEHADRLPSSPFLMISNHRSFLDAPLLMAAAQRPVHFACHHYMSQVPVMRDVVGALGCFPLDQPQKRGRDFFRRATDFLRSQSSIGVFPEGTGPMVDITAPNEVGPFHRGFAHLALRYQSMVAQPPMKDLKIVPTAIVALEEKQQDTVPFQLLSWFDPSEPLFRQSGRHPAVVYRRVTVIVGKPVAVSDWLPQVYGGKRAGTMANELSNHCHAQVQALLKAGCY